MFFLRLISWVCLVGLFFSALLFEKSGWYILLVMFVFGALVSCHEILKMLEKLELKSFKKTSALVTALSIIFIFAVNEKYLLLPLTLFVTGCWGYLLFGNDKKSILKKTAVSLGGMLMALIPIFFLSRVYCYSGGEGQVYSGAKLLLFLVVVTKIGDTFAYITGMLSNKILKGKNHKIVPSISPKKSWEGTIGGMIFSIISSYLLYSYVFGSSSLILPFITGIFLFWGGFSGDLAESALKRSCGVKDSGSILPGMGGVYDLLDSFIFNAPLFYFLIMVKASLA
jgi:phosphatidate cytidylyltransferase